MTWQQWPALSAASLLIESELTYRRAVWGKVHGERSDFRWIAASVGMRPTEQQIDWYLGSEDAPIAATMWKLGAEGVHYAVACYPSRAFDAAGRSGFLEKQVLEWRGPSDLPPAAAAFFLLRHAAALDDTVWWGRQRGLDWTQPETILEIAPEQSPPLKFDAYDLADTINAGISEILKALGGTEQARTALARLYADILKGQRPAFLRVLGGPLGPPALAALLLPLPRERSDRVALASWLPSSRFRIEDLTARWDVIVIGEKHSVPVNSTPANVDAERMAEALVQNRPELLATIHSAAERPSKLESCGSGSMLSLVIRVLDEKVRRDLGKGQSETAEALLRENWYYKWAQSSDLLKQQPALGQELSTLRTAHQQHGRDEYQQSLHSLPCRGGERDASLERRDLRTSFQDGGSIPSASTCTPDSPATEPAGAPLRLKGPDLGEAWPTAVAGNSAAPAIWRTVSPRAARRTLRALPLVGALLVIVILAVVAILREWTPLWIRNFPFAAGVSHTSAPPTSSTAPREVRNLAREAANPPQDSLVAELLSKKTPSPKCTPSPTPPDTAKSEKKNGTATPANARGNRDHDHPEDARSRR